MYRILIADDERDERKVIRFLLNKYNFQLEIDEASNGKEALSHLETQPVDILFTDIKMPFVDGIELATRARELYPNLHIIFFSGHDDFYYAKKAISLRAVEYILKPVKPVEFQNTISTVLQNIKKEEKEHELREANSEFLKTHVLYRLINKTPIGLLKTEYSAMNFDFLNHYSAVMLMQFEEPFFDRLPKEQDTFFFYNQTKKIIPEYPCDFINLNPFQILLLFGKTERNTVYKEIAIKIQKQVYLEYGINCYISVSKEFLSPSELPEIYDELEQYLEDRFFYSDTYIYPIDTSTRESKEYLEQDEHIQQKIQSAIQLVDIVTLKQNMGLLFQKYQAKQGFSHIYVRYFFSKLLQTLCQELPHYNKELINKKMETIFSCRHFSQIETILVHVQDEVIEKLEKKEQSPKHVIHLVQQYITEHYGEDLSLNLLAEKVYLSPSYLSEIFIKETGCGINKYIKNLRMENAKNLLNNTNMKITDICKQLGYHNLSYFVRSFREHFGSSPEKYRQMKKQ
ncbi:response regulator transcription factor [Neobacillus niacini]|uniref:response regulator transcription factor n=1 Tax=Neobacillus niacini TaxID=86668 RepID=UPI003000115A